MLAIEANDEWLVGRSYIGQKSRETLWNDAAEKPLPLKTEEELSEVIAA